MSKKQKINKKWIKLTSAFTLAFLIIISGIYFYYIYKKNREILDEQLQNMSAFCEFRRKLDGSCVAKDEENLWPVAVMIDNHPDAWPVAGLSKSQLVYNTLVEGGSTRLMAVFASDDEIEKIGPVRSARPYYLTWAKGLDALYGHSGGSTEALEKIQEYKIIDWEEITGYGPLYFQRDYSKFSPHNLFTSNQKISQARIDWQLADKTPGYTPWQFDQNASSTLELVKNIYIDYSLGTLFDIEYKYSSSTQTYFRWQNNELYVDALDNSFINTKNLIVQFVPAEEHLDTVDRLRIETIGQGPAWIFYNGKMIKARWIKNSPTERTMFYNQDGQEIIFKPGNIWVEVVPGDRDVNVF